jgi:hypothetical protein
VEILPVHRGKSPKNAKKKLDYRLLGGYYLLPAGLLVIGEIIRDGQKTGGLVLKGFIATHGDGV